MVDGSEPVLELHAAEMEILRMTGQPRLAVINRTGTDDHMAEWKRRLGLHFNAVREFNAHRAGLAERTELLETLAGIEQSWKPKLARAVAILREEWEKRVADCAEIIVELLIDALVHVERAPAPELKARRAATREELKERFIRTVSKREARAHHEMIELFRHRLVKAGAAETQLFGSDLFSDETWRAFGLDEKQLMVAGAIAGAAGGAAVDILTVGHTLLLGSAIGGTLGGAGAWVLGKRRPELKVSVPGESPLLPKMLRFGGSHIVIGPYAALNFPWILLDRAIGAFCYLAHRAHARRDETTLDSEKTRAAMDSAGLTSARWSEEKRKQCERHFANIRKNKMTPEERYALRELLRARLEEVARAEVAFD